MKNALPEQRKLLAVYRGLLRQFADVRAGDKGLLARAGQNQHADGGIVARGHQCIAQFLDGPAIQRIQDLRPIEGDNRNRIAYLIQNIFVCHFECFPSLKSPASKTSWPSASPDPNNHKILDRPSGRSSPPAPCASTTAVMQTASPGTLRT